MADSKITDLNPMTAGVLARTIDVVPIVDVSATEDKKVTIQQIMDDAPVTGSNPGSMSVADKTKLDGVATGATANSSDATLLNRANHTGTQTASTISNFNEAAQDAVGTILTDTSTIDFTYNDAGNTISAIVVANSIGNTQLRTGAATSVVGRSANSVGALADIEASADGQYLTRAGGALSFAVIPNFTSSAAGLAPASGGGTTNFLRADGTWAAPSGGGGGGDNVSVNGSAATDINLSDSTPAPPSGGVNVSWQKDTAAPDNVSAYFSIDQNFIYNFYRSAFLFNDFLSTGTLQPFVGTAVASGTISNIAPTSHNNVGTIRLITASTATANSGYRIHTDIGAVVIGGDEYFLGTAKFESFTDTVTRFGLHDSSSTTDAVDGAYFEIVGSTATAKTASNSTRTSNATTATLSTGVWYTFKILVNSDATSVNFQIQNNSTSDTVLNVNNTENIPTGSARAMGVNLISYRTTAASSVGLVTLDSILFANVGVLDR